MKTIDGLLLSLKLMEGKTDESLCLNLFSDSSGSIEDVDGRLILQFDSLEEFERKSLNYKT